jgi:hypothetical protein
VVYEDKEVRAERKKTFRTHEGRLPAYRENPEVMIDHALSAGRRRTLVGDMGVSIDGQGISIILRTLEGWRQISKERPFRQVVWEKVETSSAVTRWPPKKIAFGACAWWTTAPYDGS